MKLVIFGLTITSSWGNGHATLWRGLCKALLLHGCSVVFFEKDVPYYAANRDFTGLPGLQVLLYTEWSEVEELARKHLADADVAMVTSYCPAGAVISDYVLSSPAKMRVFYDLDSPVTLKAIREGRRVEYVSPRGLGDFDLVLSYTGGVALKELRDRLGAKLVLPLYGSVDPDLHRPVPSMDSYRCDLSYLGTDAEDRQTALNTLFLEPSRRLPGKKFLMGGALYPPNFPWTPNLFFLRHVPPPDHAAFYCSSGLTLNVTRQAMAEMGYCPSGRLFEAAACAAPILSDTWEGLERFFQPGSEILTAHTTEDVVAALEMGPEKLRRVGRAARERTLDMHTAYHRARDLEAALDAGWRKEKTDFGMPPFPGNCPEGERTALPRVLPPYSSP